MCGIVAYIGDKPATDLLLVALTRLEYRGYDSAGLAILDGGDLQICKEVGKIKDLEKSTFSHKLEGSLGIGHTRWATHGSVNKENSHPHVNASESIAVVHNGIIENFYQLKKELIEKDYIFHSETDTETLAHLLDEELEKTGDMKEALYNLTQKIEGRYSLSVIYDKEPKKIFFAKNGSPLIYGESSNGEEAFFASDIPAIVTLAGKSLNLEDGTWGYMERSQKNKKPCVTLSIFDADKNELKKTFSKITLKASEVEKGDYAHFMLKEIEEQPQILRSILERRINSKNEILFEDMAQSETFFSNINNIIMISAGTSWHAALVGRMYLENFSKIATHVDFSSEFRYKNPIVAGDTQVIAISQSGETADTLASVHEAKAKFLPVLSFVNQKKSSIARESDSYIDLLAGIEIGVASTKAYISQLLNLLLYSLYLGKIRNRISASEINKILDELRQIPDKVEMVIEKKSVLRDWAKNFRKTKDCIFLGRTWNYPTALEGALKLKEISYIHASGYAAGEFKHGPIALISDGLPVVCVASNQAIHSKMLSSIEEVTARKGKVISIFTEGDTVVPKISEYSFSIAPCEDFLSPLLSVVPLQLLAYYTAVERGCEADQPRNLAKSVTVE